MKQALERIFRFIFPHKNPAMVKRVYHMPESLKLEVEFTQDGWFVATSPELPGLITEARDKEELVEMVNDAALTYFNVPRRDADVVYDEFRLGDEVIKYKGELKTRIA